MASSRKWYVYTDDKSNEWGVELDEDTGGLQGLGFTAISSATDLDTLPRGITMRSINAVQTSGSGAGFRYRKFPVGEDSATLFAGTSNTFTINGLNYTVTSVRGEKARKPYGENTGLVGQSPTVGESIEA
jgi:hypothetical protein